jgi:hypothetical protein
MLGLTAMLPAAGACDLPGYSWGGVRLAAGRGAR